MATPHRRQLRGYGARSAPGSILFHIRGIRSHVADVSAYPAVPSASKSTTLCVQSDRRLAGPPARNASIATTVPSFGRA
jgi:hypothetical protein